MHKTGIAALKSALTTDIPQPEFSLMTTLVDHYRQQHGEMDENYILSDCLDHFWAGVSTTANGLAALVFRLSLPPDVAKQKRFLVEVSSAASNEDLTGFSYLNSVVKETLRLHPPIIASLDRTTRTPVEVDGCPIASGMNIGAQAYSLHRNEDVFPSPDEWQPERWGVDTGSEQSRARSRHFFAFSESANVY